MSTIASTHLDRGVIEKQLNRILASPQFADTTRLNRFLQYLVDRTLDGSADSLKGYAIGVDVFDKPDDFDPAIDTIVRVQAGKLRTRLDLYYADQGKDDPLRILVPKGSYAPVFEVALDAEKDSNSRNDASSSGKTASDHRYRIAVLPFDNLSGSPEQEFLADGFTEEILNALARFRELQVISRNSTFRYKNRAVDPRDIGSELGVRYLVEGSVRRWDNQVRVTVQLIETETGAHLSSEVYNREISAQNLFDIQEDIASRIAAELAEPHGIIHRVGSRHRQAGTQALDAYECRLLASEYWRAPNRDSHARVVKLLERAVTIDSEYAGAWAMLAIVYGDEVRGNYHLGRDTDPLDRALDAAKRAVAIDPVNATGHHALFLTHFNRGELPAYRGAADKALALNPNYPDLLADYGACLGFSGEWDRGREFVQRALDLSPHPPGWYRAYFAIYHYIRGEYDQALEQMEAAVLGAWFWGDLIRAMVHGQLGHEEEARTYAQSALTNFPEFESNAGAALSIWNFRDEDTARLVEGWQKAGLTITD